MRCRPVETCHLSTKVLCSNFANFACTLKDIVISVTQYAWMWINGGKNTNEKRKLCLGATRGSETFRLITLLGRI
jgi:hypothetical protein